MFATIKAYFKRRKNLHRQFKGKLPVINKDFLTSHDACYGHTQRFLETFGDTDVQINLENAIRAADGRISIGWLSDVLLSNVGLREYDRRKKTFWHQPEVISITDRIDDEWCPTDVWEELIQERTRMSNLHASEILLDLLT